MIQIPQREPISISAGDTVLFTRSLPDYLATDGWALKYELRGGAQPIEFQSTADVDSHSVNVPAADTALWLPGDYVMVGYAVLASTGERHQIYYGEIIVAKNLAGSAGDVDVKTFYQKMVEKLEAVMLNKAGHDILESEIEGTKIGRLDPLKLHDLWVKFKNLRANEIAVQRAKAGLPTGNKIRPQFRITQPVNGLGMPVGPEGQFIVGGNG